MLVENEVLLDSDGNIWTTVEPATRNIAKNQTKFVRNEALSLIRK